MKLNLINESLFVITISFIYLCLPTNLFGGIESTYYVSPGGNDNNPGTEAEPFATINKARDVVRTINGNMTGDIIIYLRDGTYELSSTFRLTSLDKGTNGYNIIYQSFNCESPLISGGIKITNWSLHDSAKNIYQSVVGKSINTRQLYVNGKRAIRARSQNAVGWSISGDGYTCPDTVAKWGTISGVEVVAHWNFKSHRGSIASVSGTHVTMDQPYWDEVNMQGDGTPVWIENAYELLDEEGEWYLDRSTGVLYYKPRTGEDMTTAEVVLPILDTLISGSYVNNVDFKGITFAYATWLQPDSNVGFACLQADYYRLNDSFQVIPGNIIFDHSTNLEFDDDLFEHFGATSLHLYLGCQNNIIHNSIFRDISGSAISIDDIRNWPLLANYNTTDLPKDNTIDNNLITRTALEYEGCVGIFVTYSEHTLITHNTIIGMPYTGISVGWGWSPKITNAKNNEISYNLVDSVMMTLKDGSAIYALSAQPGTDIDHNYINNVSGNYGGLYADYGSSYMHFHHNVIKSNNTKNWWFFNGDTSFADTVDYNYHDSPDLDTFKTHYKWIFQNNVYVSDSLWPANAQNIMDSAGIIPTNVTSIALNSHRLDIAVGNTANLNYTISPCTASDNIVIWSSIDTSIAVVSPLGVIKAKAIGQTKIAITTQDGNKTDTCLVNVTNKGGIKDISFNPESAFVYPNPITGYQFTIDGLKNQMYLINLVDLNGVIHKQYNIDGITKEVLVIPNELTNGIYLVQIIGSDGVHVNRVELLR